MDKIIKSLKKLFIPYADKKDRYRYFREQTIVILNFVGIIIGGTSLLFNRTILSYQNNFYPYGAVSLSWLVVSLLSLMLLRNRKITLSISIIVFYYFFILAFLELNEGLQGFITVPAFILVIMLIGIVVSKKYIFQYAVFLIIIYILVGYFTNNTPQHPLDVKTFLFYVFGMIFLVLTVASILYLLRIQVEIHIREEHSRLTEINNLLNAVVFTSPLAIYVMEDNKIKLWNTGAENMFGWTEDEVLNKPLIILPNEKKDEFITYMNNVNQGENVFRESMRKAKNGNLIPVSITSAPLRDSENKIIGVVEIVKDITERKEMEKRKDEFISMASHELKTPITSLKMYGNLLVTKLSRNTPSEDIKSLAGKMNKQLAKLNELVRELLDISKIQTGKITLNYMSFNLNDLITDVVSNVQLLSPRHQLIIESNDEVVINADRNRIGQVITNILINAVKFSKEDSKVLINSIRKENEVKISIQDFGIGINEEYHEKIFEKFYQVSNEKERTYPGMGMGLFISSEIVSLHHGSITVKSKKDQGSTFIITLPVSIKNDDKT